MEVPPRIDHPGLIIAGDKSKHLSPFGGTDRPHHKRDLFARCLLGSTAIGKARFLRRWTLDPWPRDRSGGYAEVLVSPLGLASRSRSSRVRMACRRLNGDSRKHLRPEFYTYQKW
jgi:hypothetical protein